MSTVIRSEISENNPYWIPKRRYLELKNFCLQYPEWKAELSRIDGYRQDCSAEKPVGVAAYIDPTADLAMGRLQLRNLMELVEKTAEETDRENAVYILDAVIHGYTYEYLCFRGMLISEYAYRKLYRKFFWLLSIKRK